VGKIKQKALNSKQLTKGKRLCPFGLDLTPSCGKYFNIFDLGMNPDLKKDLADGLIPPYCYQYADNDTVHMDQCVPCFLKRGFSMELYEKINYLMTGITRENYKEKLEIFKFYVPEAIEYGNAVRKELIEEMIRDGIPVDMNLYDLPDC